MFIRMSTRPDVRGRATRQLRVLLINAHPDRPTPPGVDGNSTKAVFLVAPPNPRGGIAPP